jgi:hypothetical protein
MSRLFAAVRPLGRAARRWIDAALDQLRLRLDTFPRRLYQPVDSLPVRHVTRAEGSSTRWAAIRPLVERLQVRSAVDAGANAGYFSIELGALGIPTLAIECDPRAVRIATLAIRRSMLSNVGLLALTLDTENAVLLPAVDCMLWLSLWHHVVRAEGLAVASDLLARCWSRTAKVLFFDTGEREMPASFGLPDMAPDSRTWLAGYLERTCAGSRIEHLGQHTAFDAEGNPCKRHLFAVVRTAPDVQSARAWLSSTST